MKACELDSQCDLTNDKDLEKTKKTVILTGTGSGDRGHP
jgi:hypothetical protein